MKQIKPSLVISLFLLLLIFAGCANPKQFELKNGYQWYPFMEWSIEIPDYTGNQFDIIANVEFIHENTGEVVTTQMFYDMEEAWRFRFTGIKTGKWIFNTVSDNKDLDGWSGEVYISDNPDENANGFMTTFGSKWGWEGTEKAFIPQYVMGRYLRGYIKDDMTADLELIESDINEFVNGHGFTGFHFSVEGDWFEEDNPDGSIYTVLETIITKVHKIGGACHIWMWYSNTDALNGDRLNDKDRRNLRYLAARLGPLPGWSLSYGVDVENGWISAKELDDWKGFLEEHLGYDHFIGARVGYDEHGLFAADPRPPRPPVDENRNAPVGDEYMVWLGGDYYGYTSYRPLYDRYIEVINHRPEKPSFEEDRFRLRDVDRWRYKDYSEELTRRGLWHSSMAGGVANIWGNFLPHDDQVDWRVLNTLGSKPYVIKDQIKTYSLFFKDRFLKEFHSRTEDSALVLYTPSGCSYIAYLENTETVSLEWIDDFSGAKIIAVDTKREYNEIPVSLNDDKIWQAPRRSDWALAIGQVANVNQN